MVNRTDVAGVQREDGCVAGIIVCASNTLNSSSERATDDNFAGLPYARFARDSGGRRGGRLATTHPVDWLDLAVPPCCYWTTTLPEFATIGFCCVEGGLPGPVGPQPLENHKLPFFELYTVTPT
jgi:hypothetical protein